MKATLESIVQWLHTELQWLLFALLLSVCWIFFHAIYNLSLHPLAEVPGPFWARVSGIPSWYHALRGDRHIWLWQQFQIHGDRIRPEPNTVLFCEPSAYADIYGTKSNVRRSHFYTAFKRSKRENTTINSIDVAEHAHRRKLLNICFTEKSVRAAGGFITSHVDRWNEIIASEVNPDSGWTPTIDFSDRVDALVFDILGDLCFGKSFDIKEAGDNPLKVIPHSINEYMRFYYPMCRSPFLNLLLWLKPRGLDSLFELITPPAVKQYNQFVHNSVSQRMELYEKELAKPEDERRQDMFYFLRTAQDPDTGLPAYDEHNLRAESSLLIIAGSDTTAISLSGIFFYLTGDPARCQKLANEIRTTFESAEEIVQGPKLQSCKYLKACIDEGMRLTPSGPSEFPREVLPGGITISDKYYPAGTIVGVSPWCNSRNQGVFGDAHRFRPERWIVDEAAGVTKDDVSRQKAGFQPFISGPTNCVGKNLAMIEMMVTVGRTLYRLDVRRAPGSTFGGGAPEMGWGARDKDQFQVLDAYISQRKGPEVQFRLKQ
ncbi:Cytochrome P450 monooxygenase apf7 [Paramyrothecium foliicola]|nr:Cytochrome P450 monooxygenase apf7 [Paramyrothecium foliicola]